MDQSPVLDHRAFCNSLHKRLDIYLSFRYVINTHGDTNRQPKGNKMKTTLHEVTAEIKNNTVILKINNLERQRKECPTNAAACSYVRMMVSKQAKHGLSVKIAGDYTPLFGA